MICVSKTGDFQDCCMGWQEGRESKSSTRRAAEILHVLWKGYNQNRAGSRVLQPPRTELAAPSELPLKSGHGARSCAAQTSAEALPPSQSILGFRDSITSNTLTAPKL